MKPLLIFICSILLGSAVFLFSQNTEQPSVEPAKTPTYGIEVVNIYPHDSKAFTQGLLYHDGFLYESTGIRGQSSLRKVELESGKVLQKSSLNSALFGEGLAMWEQQLVQLTWKAGAAIVYNFKDFKVLKAFPYSGEGWGLTTNEDGFIMSDGSADLRFIDPTTFHETKRITVTDNGKAVKNINELEYIRGEIFANIWLQSKIARIDPNTGKVLAWIDLSKLVPAELQKNTNAVLNGIAYHAEKDRIFITGKLWSKLYEIKLIENK